MKKTFSKYIWEKYKETIGNLIKVTVIFWFLTLIIMYTIQGHFAPIGAVIGILIIEKIRRDYNEYIKEYHK